MNRLQSYYEQLQVPLKTLFVAAAMIAVGSLLSNPYLGNIIKLDNNIIVTTAQLLRMCGGTILSYFPVYVFVKLLSHEKSEQNIVIAGIMAYIVFLTTLVIMQQGTSPAAAYNPLFNFTIGETKRQLYRTGIFGIASIYFWVRYVFRKSNRGRNISSSSIVDGETSKIFISIVGGIVIGLAFTYIWPIILSSIYSVMKFVSLDSNNPMSLFAYGALERVMALGNIPDILHQEFWLSQMGGTWMDLSGNTFIGDVNIWTAQLKETINSYSAGRFTTGYYVMNLFAVPGYLVALYRTISNKKIRNRNILVLVIAILVSAFGGILLPVELLMLITSPTIYFFHIFMTAFVYAILRGFSVAFGFSYFGSLITSTPGNLPDLLGIAQNPALFSKVIILLLVGVLIFVSYFSFTRLYYRRLAIDLLNTSNQGQRIEDFADALGGYDNIESISSSITRVHVQLLDRDKINVAPLHRDGVVRIIETRQGFILSIGSSAYMIQRDINKVIEKRLSEKNVEEVDTNE